MKELNLIKRERKILQHKRDNDDSMAKYININ